MKFDNVTFVVDLNDMSDSGNTFISRQHTVEHGRGQAVSYHGLAMRAGDRVEVFSDDEDMTWEAEIVGAVDSDQFEVSIRWETGPWPEFAANSTWPIAAIVASA